MRRPRIFLSPPHLNGQELGLVQEAFASNYIAPLGPMSDAFEREFASYTGIAHCLAVNSGTAAMHLALREIGVGPGDHVLASSLTFIGSVTPATFLGATVGFIDSDRATWNMDPGLLRDELENCARQGPLPRAVIPTDLYGQCADLDRISAICSAHGIPVIADSAEAAGAFYQKTQGSEASGQKSEVSGQKSETRGQKSEARGQKSEGGGQRAEEGESRRWEGVAATRWVHAGVGAKAAVYSFNGNKIITSSGGGMLASDDEHLIAHARKLSQQAREPAPHYEHSEIGYNYRMSNIVAAIGLGQLRGLDQRVREKRRIFEKYQRLLAGLPGIEFMPEASYSRSNRWLTVILVNADHFGATPDEIRIALEADNIESRPIWKPMHMQPVFRGCQFRGNGVSEDLFRRGLCLPSGTALTDSDLERVAGVIRRLCQCKN